MEKRIMVRLMPLILAVALLAGCGQTAVQTDGTAARGRTVVDMQGTEVTVPEVIENYAVAWAGDFDIAAMMDGCEHISAYPDTSLRFEKVMEVYPQLADCIALPKENIAVESILESGAQVVFLRQSDYPDLTRELRAANVPVVDLNFENYEELKHAVELFAEVLNTQEARDKAALYTAYVDDTIAQVQEFVKFHPSDEEITVLNFRDAVDFTAYSKDRLVGSWAELCGITYALDTGNSTSNITLTQEQILEYDPDYIFFTFPGNAEKLLANERLQSLTAVQQGHVYDVPAVINSFAVNGTEAVLQMKWAISLIWEGQTTFDLNVDIRDFYRTFFDLELSEEETARILYEVNG